MLVDQWLLPRPKTVHNSHFFLSLRRETRDLLTLDNRLASSGVEKASKNGWAMAAVLLLVTIATRRG
jgi:hypothetical protein